MTNSLYCIKAVHSDTVPVNSWGKTPGLVGVSSRALRGLKHTSGNCSACPIYVCVVVRSSLDTDALIAAVKRDTMVISDDPRLLCQSRVASPEFQSPAIVRV